MKSATFIALIGALLILPVSSAAAADAQPGAKAAAKKSMAEKGSFHRIHKQKEKLDCEDCHEKGGLPDNTLKLRLHEPLAKDSPGAVSSASCHECHGKKQKKQITWYAPKAPKPQ
jgi:Zn finger protein HypA/HybF involved in hydrogenase expression